jgi:alpha-galactosidase
MTDYGVDTWRSDFGAPSGPGGLAMLDWLMANHPKFRYEYCDCGAPQKDFVMAQRSTVMFGIDIYDTLSNRKMFHVSSYCLPPAQIQSPIDVLTAPPAFALRSAMQGAFDVGIGTHGGKLVMPSDYPILIEPARENLALYKTRLRPLIREANLYHLFLRPDGVDWDGLQYYNPASRKGAVLLFKPNNKVDTRRVCLKGLDRHRLYALSFQDRLVQNARKTGAELMEDGWDVTMAGTNVSEIVWIDEAR